MRIAIQGELGSNSHMAAVVMSAGMESDVDIAACTTSEEVFDAVESGMVDAAVLPIENSLHGSVAPHYDLLLARRVRVTREICTRIRHNVIACPGVLLENVKEILSHPVALSQCRHWQARHSHISALPFYDTAGAVKYVLERGLQETAAVAPVLAAEVYGGTVLVAGIEDHAENYTRFHLVVKEEAVRKDAAANKLTVAFAVEHRPGTLVRALGGVAEAGADLTKIESRPVPGCPWEYVFYVDLRFPSEEVASEALAALRAHCTMVKELGRYEAARSV